MRFISNLVRSCWLFFQVTSQPFSSVTLIDRKYENEPYFYDLSFVNSNYGKFNELIKQTWDYSMHLKIYYLFLF